MRSMFMVCSALLLVLAGCATLPVFVPPAGVAVIAHRGASHDAPENTLAAFRLARDMGADWFELDCHLSRDGLVVVSHDNELERTTGAQGTITESDYAYLQSLDAGAWKGVQFAGERLPLFSECLDFAKNSIGVYVEIKNEADDTALMGQILKEAEPYPVMTPEFATWMIRAIEANGTRNLELTRKTIALIRERGMAQQVVIQSFSPIICAIAKIEAPEMRVEALSGVKLDEHDIWELVTRWLFLLDLDGLNLSHESVTPGRMATVKQSGKTVAVWTVDEKPIMDRVVGLGADAIITNRPDVALSALGRR
ncbi:MAG TPA: glycerophosphodiester phosphodiesterase family protein [Candidatus Hydrogenedentes bacterium]|nr:glycerophosphodiester phosphodiesterase family protein [Candidatus Hydrogenedentota bacterium]